MLTSKTANKFSDSCAYISLDFAVSGGGGGVWVSSAFGAMATFWGEKAGVAFTVWKINKIGYFTVHIHIHYKHTVLETKVFAPIL